MSYNIIPTPVFQKDVKNLSKKYHSFKHDIIALKESLIENPAQGTPIGNNCYKIRMAIASKGKGKSGGARVITHVHIIKTNIFLLTVYDKSEKGNISDNEIEKLLAFIN